MGKRMLEKPEISPDGKRRLDEGKTRMKRRCIAVALQNTPPDVHTISIRRTLNGQARSDGRMVVPRPFTRKSLYVFLHECSHYHLGHLRAGARRSIHVREYESEIWAQEKMRSAGIPVPRAMTERARLNVAFKIIRARRRGVKRIDPAALRFAKLQGDCVVLGKKQIVLIPL